LVPVKVIVLMAVAPVVVLARVTGFGPPALPIATVPQLSEDGETVICAQAAAWRTDAPARQMQASIVRETAEWKGFIETSAEMQ
jgi:hypothetical protein